ncbi:hypothetical protein SeMB42_g04966 [Synchytrium endobioticum]|uniref:BAR domain-containing protein n=1 Tax=Synchytrium endobioticum TaxID=286115 RepID=A0A507D543_9FUNG|nr:hypothetical protein SeMB42_g04966 [Synchytrium endobioticum]TPX46435.1 hypothetical protein SeLEV6574_g03233 [Synchytrium endobioticum]
MSILGKLTHDIKKAAQGTGLLQDHAELNVYLVESKEYIRFAKALAAQNLAVSKARTEWAKKSQHDDIQDICSHLAEIDSACASATACWANALHASRERLKAMRAKENALDTLKKRRDKLRNELALAQKSGKPATPNLGAELYMVESQVLHEDAEYEGLKRTALQASYYDSYDAFSHLAMRFQVIATFGKHMADQIPQGTPEPGQPLPRFTNAHVTNQIANDFNRAYTPLISIATQIPLALSQTEPSVPSSPLLGPKHSELGGSVHIAQGIITPPNGHPFPQHNGPAMTVLGMNGGYGHGNHASYINVYAEPELKDYANGVEYHVNGHQTSSMQPYTISSTSSLASPPTKPASQLSVNHLSQSADSLSASTPSPPPSVTRKAVADESDHSAAPAPSKQVSRIDTAAHSHQPFFATP